MQPLTLIFSAINPQIVWSLSAISWGSRRDHVNLNLQATLQIYERERERERGRGQILETEKSIKVPLTLLMVLNDKLQPIKTNHPCERKRFCLLATCFRTPLYVCKAQGMNPRK